jgi:hypothetical protein
METQIGFPDVDLCIILGTSIPYSPVSTFLAYMGVMVDRWSVRNYVRRRLKPVASTELYGIKLPVPVVSLAALAASTNNGSPVEPSDVLSACCFPSVQKTVPASR